MSSPAGRENVGADPMTEGFNSTPTPSDRNIFAIPVLDQVILYAPLHNLAALVNRRAAAVLRDDLITGRTAATGQLAELLNLLAQPESEPPPRQGDFVPTFLGLLPTRGCNLACEYCGFLTPDESKKVMDLELARDAVNWYMDHVRRSGAPHAEVHFFGGEPFCAEDVIDLAVTLAKRRAEEIGCSLRFEVATNGTFSEARCRWVADNLDTIVLSFDGPADVQNLHRPYKNGAGSFEIVARNARILSAGDTNLFIRACVTSETVERMPEIAAWFYQEFRPSAVSFEPLQPTSWSLSAGLHEPDPWVFAENYIAAARLLEAHGVEPIYAPSEISARQVTFCPVGKDFVIVSPDGTLSACYLLQRDWEAQGLDLRLGYMDGRNGHAVHLDADAVHRIRRMNVHNKSLCAPCFCKWHCAGGCHVNHRVENLPPGAYDRLCIQTRIITLRNILHAMGRDDLALALLQALERAVCQASDLLRDGADSL
jgi:uncharacterized protein